MTTTAHALASGPGWHVTDVICSAGPQDRAYEERHGSVCIAAVTRGTFQYRSSQGRATLAPGAVMLGNHGACFECSHEHGVGDRCISFHLAPAFLESVVADVPGAQPAFQLPRLPPLPELMRVIAAAEHARDEGDRGALEEIALRLAGAVVTTLADRGPRERAGSSRDEHRISNALRRIERDPANAVSLNELASDAAMSPYHFLRVFRQVAGITPHQFILRMRLHAAALQLWRSQESISTIAFDAGFNDLSTFNRRFRRLMGVTPGDYRNRLGG
jgi:AraC-like DNA-binding protein